MNDNFEQQENEQIQRPQALSTLCTLSYIGSGLSLLANTLVFVFYNTFVSYLLSEEVKEVATTFDPEVLHNFAVSAGRFYFLFASALYFLSVLGVYYMWHLIKRGIHFYAIAQISLVILPLVFIDSSLSAIPGLIFSGAFIYFYSRFLKIMR